MLTCHSDVAVAPGLSHTDPHVRQYKVQDPEDPNPKPRQYKVQDPEDGSGKWQVHFEAVTLILIPIYLTLAVTPVCRNLNLPPALTLAPTVT